MKQKDVLVIVSVAIFSAVVALVLSNMLFVKPETKAQQVEKIETITTDFKSESVKKYINKDAVNPSQLIEVTESDKADPFQ